jgi:hypothetical protein
MKRIVAKYFYSRSLLVGVKSWATQLYTSPRSSTALLWLQHIFNVLEVNLATKREPKTELLRVRLTKAYHQKLKAYAAKHGVSESHVVNEYIRRLPHTDLPKSEEE